VKRLSSYVSMPSGKRIKIPLFKKVCVIIGMGKKLFEKCQKVGSIHI
jgi:hypothetical protein